MNQLHQSSRIPGAIRLADYRVPDFLVDTVALYIDIRAGITRITADLAMRRNPASGDHQTSLRLDGEGIALREILLDASRSIRTSTNCMKSICRSSAFRNLSVCVPLARSIRP